LDLIARLKIEILDSFESQSFLIVNGSKVIDEENRLLKYQNFVDPFEVVPEINAYYALVFDQFKKLNLEFLLFGLDSLLEDGGITLFDGEKDQFMIGAIHHSNNIRVIFTSR
jgi:hypothetical protein